MYILLVWLLYSEEQKDILLKGVAMNTSTTQDNRDNNIEYNLAAAEEELKAAELALAPDHPDVAYLLHETGVLNTAAGNYARAEELHKRSIDILENAAKPELVGLASALCCLGIIYMLQQRYISAESLLCRAESIFSNHQPPTYLIKAACCQFHVAVLHQKVGRYFPAIRIFENTLVLLEDAEEVDAADNKYQLSICCVKSLLLLYETVDLLARKYPVYQRELEKTTLDQVPLHLEVGTTLLRWAVQLKRQNNFTDAETFFKRALKNLEQTYGLKSPEVADCLETLAKLYRVTKRTADARKLENRIASFCR